MIIFSSYGRVLTNTNLDPLPQDFLANELQLQFEKLSNQARFVQMIINRELVVSNRKKADIVAELRQKDFRPFPKVAKAKAAGENEDAEEEEPEVATGTSTDYDYLLGMAIWSLTKEKVRMSPSCDNRVLKNLTFLQIEKLLQQAADKEAELLALLELTPIKIWNTDLDHFLAEWDVSLVKRRLLRCESLTHKSRKRAKSGRRKASSTRAARKSNGNKRRSRRASPSLAAVPASADAATTLTTTTISCRPKKPQPLPPKHRANPSRPPLARRERHPSSKHLHRTTTSTTSTKCFR